jgi:hypothetical protein
MARTSSLSRAFLTAATLTALLTTIAAAEPLAVIAAVKGRVQIVGARSRAPQRAIFGRALERGDRVTVGPGGSATVFFDDGNLIELGEKSSVTIGGRVGSKTAAGQRTVPGDVYAQVSKFVTSGSRETGLVAMSSMRGGSTADDAAPLIMAPRKTALLDARPAFRWRGVAGAERYRVRVSAVDGAELWSREVTGTTLAYPADAPALEAVGGLRWQVEALAGSRILRDESSEFRVLPRAMTDSVRANVERLVAAAGGGDSPAARYLAGSYLFGLGLYHDASGHFARLVDLTPGSAAPHEALGSVYQEVGLMDLAAAEFQQALALTREP